MKDWRVRVPCLGAVVTFGGFLVMRYFGADPFPGRVRTVLGILGALTFPLVMWWLAGHWRPPVLVVPGLVVTLAPSSWYRDSFGWHPGLGLVGLSLLTHVLSLVGLTWGLWLACRRGVWRQGG